MREGTAKGVPGPSLPDLLPTRRPPQPRSLFSRRGVGRRGRVMARTGAAFGFPFASSRIFRFFSRMSHAVTPSTAPRPSIQASVHSPQQGPSFFTASRQWQWPYLRRHWLQAGRTQQEYCPLRARLAFACSTSPLMRETWAPSSSAVKSPGGRMASSVAAVSSGPATTGRGGVCWAW